MTCHVCSPTPLAWTRTDRRDEISNPKIKPVTCILCGANTYTSQGILVAHLRPPGHGIRRCPMKWKLNIWEAIPVGVENE